MKNFKRLFIISILLVLFQQYTLAKSLTSEVDRHRVSVGESFRLIVTAEGDIQGEPNFTQLAKEFKVYGTTKSHQLTIVNGQSQSKTIWTISLFPKQPGRFTIPSFNVDGVVSEPISVTVIKGLQQTTRTKSKNVFLKAFIKPLNPYELSQAIYTLRVYFSVNIQNARLTPPIADNADIEQLTDDVNYQSSYNGKVYQVLERRYLIVPQKAGIIRIKPATLSAAVETLAQNPDPWDRFFNGRDQHLIRLQAQTFKLTVQPKPESISYQQWLPASKVTLSEEWSKPLNAAQVGEPITRTIKIIAHGIKAERIPALVTASPEGFKAYTDKPILKNKMDDEGVTGIRIEKIAYIPQRDGAIQLPKISIKWWNINKKEIEESKLPQETITVQPLKATDTNSSTSSTQQNVSEVITATSENTRSKWHWSWVVTLIILVLWAVTLGLWWLSRQKERVAEMKKMKHYSSLKERQNKLKRELKKACYGNDAAALRDAMLAWARAYWPKERIQTLADITYLCDNPAFESALRELDETLYKAESSSLEGKRFWKVFLNFAKRQSKTTKKSKDDLPPLYLSK